MAPKFDSRCSQNSPPGKISLPSTLSPHCWPTMRRRCARKVQEARRWTNFDSGVEICPGQMHTEDRYLVRGKILFDLRSGLVLGLRCLLENGNFKKFCQYFLSKLSFDKLSWVFCILPSKNFWNFVKMGFSSSSVGYHGIINQFFIWFGFQEKVEYWG